ncbi:MAG TPA: thiol:disulfide interchange protein DsbA/DsbL [Gammaproteobacteria bacterium]|nr:thiol:disulfide interchange protein DsbA/DsbL [Gammaproteobacteria bacterium]
MKYAVLASLSLLLASTALQAQTPQPVAGKDYVEIPNGRPLDPVDGKVVVEEFFNYVCPACFGFEPFLLSWSAKLPPYATLVHIPATFRADFMPYARGYYAAQVLGIADKAHAAVYDAIHVKKTLPSEGQKSDEEKIAAFYAGYGVDQAQFLATMKSFGVDTKVRRATEYMTRAKVPATPTIVVNGRYLVKGSSNEQILQIASALIEKEHTAKPAN